ncbi:MAG: spore coat protein U domain-containing protein [Massilia sp.]|nr:spore coat protein U domain-containing protein [Massilia sp.]
MAVAASVLTSCLVTATSPSFGAYDPVANSAIDAANSLQVTCTIGTLYTVGLNVGAGTGATVATRKMSNGINLLNYSLYSNAARTLLWGATVGIDTVAVTAGAVSTTLPVYGRIFAGQNVSPGNYTDLVNVTVNY